MASRGADLPADRFEDSEDVLTEALAREELAAPGVRRGIPIWRRLLLSRNLAATLVAAALFAYFSLATSTFLSADNIFNMLRNLSYIAIVAVGMTYLFVAGELDLSVGSVFGFLTVVMGVLVVRAGLDPWLSLPLIVLLGVLIGAMNGLIAIRLRIPAFIVTLAGLTAFRSLALIVSGQEPSAATVEGSYYLATGGYLAGLVPLQLIWMAVVMLVGGVILATTRFGYHVYATGGNLEAVRNSGVDADRVKLVCFMLTSGLCGLVAALLFGYLHVAAPTTGTGFEFRVIGAVIVGGVALTGGRGTIYGTLLGAVIIGLITNGLVHLGYSQYFGDVATGVLIAGAGTLDLYLRHAATRSLRYLDA